jgi:hypothetical protein
MLGQRGRATTRRAGLAAALACWAAALLLADVLPLAVRATLLGIGVLGVVWWHDGRHRRRRAELDRLRRLGDPSAAADRAAAGRRERLGGARATDDESLLRSWYRPTERGRAVLRDSEQELDRFYG